MELRPRPVLTEQTYAAVLAALAPDETGSLESTEPSRPMAGVVVAGLVPAVVSVTLAIVLRNPLFAIMAVTAPLMILGPALARRRGARQDGVRSASRQPAQHPVAGRGRRPAARSATPHRSWDGVWGAAVLRAGIPAADLLTAAAGCGALPGVASPSGMARPRHGDLPDGCLAVVGPRGPAAALAMRMLVSLHATGRGETVTIVCDPSRRAAWAWVRWFPLARILAPTPLLELETGPGRLLVVDCDALAELAPRLGAWHAGHPEQAAMILLVEDVSAVPSWCAARALVEPGTGTWDARVVWSAPGTAPETTPFDGVTTDWLDGYARRVAALHQRGRWTHLEGGDGHASPMALAGRGSSDMPLGPGSAGARIPRSAALSEVPGIWDVERRWRENAQGAGSRQANGDAGGAGETLEAQIGVGPAGTGVRIDLLRDGPHALVAGTTGAGKSELLQTLILTLALTYSPDELAVALVDYKGGASFGACARLPHVVGQVTDLDPGAAERALTGLRAELHRRERLFAGVGAADLATYRARRVGAGRPPGAGGTGGTGTTGGAAGAADSEALPRLLIVVDEFRAMAEDHPDFIPGLVRIAAQGRSLGVHLILATQRPSGAITADMRANISLRIALRVAGAADSHDVIDAPDAAHLPADRPGRAVVRRGPDAPEELQTYFAAGRPVVVGPGVWHSPEPGGIDATPVRVASDDPGGRVTRSLARLPREPAEGAPASEAPATDPAAVLVAHVVQTAARLGIARPRVPWTPALPTNLSWDDLTMPAARSTLLLGLADHPREQCQRPFGWAPSDGHLLILGRAGSGRTRALRTLAHAAIASGRTVHLVGSADLTTGFDARSAHLGTRAARSDPRRVARLLTVLTSGDVPTTAGTSVPGLVEHVVIIDGLEDLLATLGALHRGDGLDLFVSALRDGPSHGTTFALSGGVLPSSSIAALVRHRLTFSSGDKHDDAFLGIPAPLAGLGGRPGRAVLVTGDAPLLCQVASAEAAISESGRDAPELATGTRAGPTRPDDRSGSPIRINEVPFPVRAGTTPSGVPGRVLLGRGGDDAGPVLVDTTRSVLVCGPHGSGRTGTLDQLLRAPSGKATDPTVTVSEATVLGVVSRDPRLTHRALELGDVPTLDKLSPGPAARFVEEVRARLAQLTRLEPTPPLRLVIDDLDAFALSCPAATEALSSMVDDGAPAHDGPAHGPGGTSPTGGPPIVLLASATTVAAAGAFRGVLADLRAARYGVVLSPGVPGSSEIFGTDLGWHVEPAVHRPGRGVLVDGSSSTFVQVAVP